MAEVKICGIRRIEDVEAVNEAEPDYVGFVFATSKRMVTIDEARELSKFLKPNIKRVGVFVDKNPEFVKKAKEECRLDVIQLHGEEDVEKYIDLNCEIWKSISIKDKQDLLKEKQYKENIAVLLDTYSKEVKGGSGQRFCWEFLNEYKIQRKWILAGGINIHNVDFALKYMPTVIDVSSGVETDGKKDRNKIIEFVRKVKNYDL